MMSQSSIVPFDGNYLNFYLMVVVMFAFVQPILVRIALNKFDLDNLSQGKTFAVLSLNGEYQNP